MPARKVINADDLIKRSPTPSIAKMIGKTFDRLTVISYAGFRKMPCGADNHYVLCRCSCGKEIIGNAVHIKHGNWVSCGCKRTELTVSRNFKHGFAPLTGKREKIYNAWKSMHARCSDRLKNEDKTRKYGEKNITVCAGWSGVNGFATFMQDMMPITDKSLDRINNDMHYSCGHCEQCIENGWTLNCRWANDKVQSNNRSGFNRYIVIDGIKMTHREADRYLGFPLKTISWRINNGWTVEQAVSIFPKSGNRRRID